MCSHSQLTLTQSSLSEIFCESIHNYPLYGKIVDGECDDDESPCSIPDNIRNIINNRRLVSEAKSMLQQLQHVGIVLNTFQSDKSNLSDCVRGWLLLLEDQNIAENVRKTIQMKFEDNITLWHLLAYIFDNRSDNERPDLPAELFTRAYSEVEEKMGDGMLAAMAAMEIEDEKVFPKFVFGKTVRGQMSASKYWAFVSKVTKSENGKNFAMLMSKTFLIPPPSAGIERIFSCAGLVHSTLRNRLHVSKVGRLVQVSRLLANCYGQKRYRQAGS